MSTYRSTTSQSNIVKAVLVLLLALAFTVGAASPALAKGMSKKKVVAIIKSVAKAKHLSNSEISALLKICKRESTFRPTARNHSCKGLFQLKTAYGYKKWSNPAWNTRKAIRYIKHRYGSCRAALSHSYRYGWY